MLARQGQFRMLGILAVTQVLSWGSLYYGIAILGPQIAREMAWSMELVYGAYSWSLILSGLAAAPAGKLLDRRGGRLVMGSGSLVAGAGMLVLALSHSLPLYFLAWSILGLAMALTLYEAAFAAINRELGMQARPAISTLTLFGGFASTVFWPLTLHLDSQYGWRTACLIYAAMHMLLCLPLHCLLPVRRKDLAEQVSGLAGALTGDATLQQAVQHPAFWKLSAAFAVNSLIFAALAVHLIPVLTGLGYAPAVAVGLAALIGPAQVAGRIAERLFFHSAPPQQIGRAAFAALPCGLAALIFLYQQEFAVGGFCVLLGASNGILTIVRGTLPQTLFGRANYGAIAGALATPSLMARAAGPLLVAALLGAGWSAMALFALFAGMAALSALGFWAASSTTAPTVEASNPPI